MFRIGIILLLGWVFMPQSLLAQSGGAFVDTTKHKIKQDSAVIDILREDQLDNIPVITVNDQDLNDA
ncbi:MAG TPA: hypothetical protein DCO78_08610, partial [Chitinophagaceae bacterium]|nr:hypothetical protein [Chitinophagaceae bacterium]